MDATPRAATAAEEWQQETRNVEVSGMVDREGKPCVAIIRRLPALELYSVREGADAATLRETYRRWAEQAVVAPTFNFNGDGGGLQWDSLPFVTHELLARQIMEFSLDGLPAAQAAVDAFRGREPAGGAPGGAGGGPDGAGDDAGGVAAA